MKKLVLILALFMSAQAFAVDMRALRGSNGFVELGNSEAKLKDVLGQPESVDTRVVHDRNGWPHKGIIYTYKVDGQLYTITIIGGNVFKINWER
ncbi:hypothetical protein M5F03_02360 [Acinetobacter sp. ANC 5579]|uniref:hypothetical protein n=1 Tax=Acinetobacter TaxID=469 RepID=UPI000993035F|nr:MULTISPECIES: hypothetical protein [Acinetobacter]MCL6234020.1 hypothetical protein [Acinetobacter amyesii]OOV81397.1 hypothetical protein B1201_09995 [Acinetobacter sp. ANC 5600]